MPKPTDHTHFEKLLEEIPNGQELTTHEFARWLLHLSSYYSLGLQHYPSDFDETKPLYEWKQEAMELF